MFGRGRQVILPGSWAYDQVQRLAGARKVRSRIRNRLTSLDLVPAVALDVGGGTGLNRILLPDSWTYICLDHDLSKLRGMAGKYPKAMALLADAASLPLADGTIGLILCTAVAHHLPDDLFNDLLGGCSRVLKNSGYFVFLDAVWEPANRVSRMLWKFDRGSYPRTAETLRSLILRHFRIERWELFAVYHRYILGVGAK